MSLALNYKGKSFQFSYTIDRKKLVVGFVILFGLTLISSRSTQDLDEKHSRIEFAKTGYEQQKEELVRLKNSTEDQITGIILKLAEVQGQLQRVNALGTRLVEQAGLSQDEFNFNTLPPSGGPITGSVITLEGNNEMISRIETMIDSLENKTQQLSALESIMLNHHITEVSSVEGRPINKGWLSSHYGVRKDPFSGMPAMHKGLDFAAKEGEKVVATGAGLVTWSGKRYGYGNLVEIDHGDGLVTRYGHNKQTSVKIGDVVTKGQQIALVGNTGRSTGAHVHYEVLRHGKQQDPLPFVYNKR